MTALTITPAEALFGVSVMVNVAWGVLYAAKCRGYDAILKELICKEVELQRRNQHNLDAWKRRSLAAEKGHAVKRATSTPRTALK